MFVRCKKITNDSEVLTVVQPDDLCVVCNPQKLETRGCLGAPDWMVEILSLGTRGRDVNEKYALYEVNGVTEYWIVHPHEGIVTVFDLTNKETTN